MSDFKISCLLLNKPSGISSNEAITKIKKRIKKKKAGFSGTLDPLASGLLIIFFNKATKLCSIFLNANKSYEAIIRLGEVSSSGDLDGDITSTGIIPNYDNLDLDILEKKYTGFNKQIPPMYSALKHKGIRLYEYARSKIIIDRLPRDIFIHNIKLKILDNNYLHLKVTCSKGTYIRSLVEQIGSDIGCGALVDKLTRTDIDNINISSAVNLEKFLTSSDEDICKNYIINVDQLLKVKTSCYLSELNKLKILNGNKVQINQSANDFVKIYDKNNNFLGIGMINENFELIPKKILV